MKKSLKVLLRIVISVSLISYLVYKQDISKIRENVIAFNFAYLFAGLCLLLLGTYVSSIRWKTILRTSNVDVGVWRLFVLYLKGYFYNNFLPTQMGGDVYKAVSVGNVVKDQSLGLFSVFMDRFSGLIMLLVVGMFGISSLYGVPGVLGAILLLVVGLAVYFPVLKLVAKKIRFFRKFEEASRMLIKNKSHGALILLYSLLIQAFSFALNYVLFLGVGIHLPFWSIIAYLPITSLATLIPSFNGFGTQEGVYAVLFSGVGVTAELSITVSIMIHVIRLSMSLFGGLLILIGFEGVEKHQTEGNSL